ncbi:YeeE/YedE family protein [Thiomicrospira microaerophila]|uniref:YeeE/YedE family protein n=1 Tax=Thiomicrospira microaerophila TaxID=406020 RepID=UPI00200C3CBF|nr:YeeE/YedE family protein [Thiomicrospira microaerophila]UQB41719.1 YeeE/YedE family protein [Thiomicrospira microaerophila]
MLTKDRLLPIRLFTLALTLALIWIIKQPGLVALLFAGMALGATLNYFMFGFSSSWRRCILSHQTAGVRAQIIMLAGALILFTPLFWLESWGSLQFQGIIRPAGLSVMLGAFLFGIGMQFAANCSSGTLNRVGQLQPLSFVSFIMLFVGGALGAYFYNSWGHWWALAPYSITLNWKLAGLLLSLTTLLVIYVGLIRLEKNNRQTLEPLWSRNEPKPFSPFLIAALLLVVFSGLILFLSGQPWSVATVFTLWSFKFSDQFNLGLDWEFWQIAQLYQHRIAEPLLADPISLTTLGVILGSLWVTLLAKKPIKKQTISPKQTAYYALGGLLMGFGATLSYGCNIGAFFSGIASGSLHGWLWIIFALLGNLVALLWLRDRND